LLRVVWLLALMMPAPLVHAERMFWYERGGYDNHFNAEYIGFGGYEDSFGFRFGFLNTPESPRPIRSKPDFGLPGELIERDVLVEMATAGTFMYGFDLNKRITPTASVGWLLWESCDVYENAYGRQYCENSNEHWVVTPGVGVLVKLLPLNTNLSLDNFTVMAGYHYNLGLGGMVSMGISFQPPSWM